MCFGAVVLRRFRSVSFINSAAVRLSAQPTISPVAAALQSSMLHTTSARGMKPASSSCRSLMQTSSSIINRNSRAYLLLQKNSLYARRHSSVLGQCQKWKAQLPAAEAGGGSGGSGSLGGGKGYSSGGSESNDDGGVWGSYNRLLASNPLFVKAVTTAILSAIGNLICQFIIEKRQDLDWRRLNTFTALGFIWVAPCLHYWFGTLNRIVTAQGNMGALVRMALDQLCFAPLFIGSMIAILTALDGKSDKIVATLKSDLPSAVRANWALWVPAQFLNFRFVPADYQVLFANVVALAWNVYFSWATRPKEATA